MLADEGDVPHARLLGQCRDRAGVKLLRGEAILQFRVFGDRYALVELDPLASAQEGIQPIVDEEAELRIAEPGEGGGPGIPGEKFRVAPQMRGDGGRVGPSGAEARGDGGAPK